MGLYVAKIFKSPDLLNHSIWMQIQLVLSICVFWPPTMKSTTIIHISSGNEAKLYQSIVKCACNFADPGIIKVLGTKYVIKPIIVFYIVSSKIMQEKYRHVNLDVS